MSKQGKAIVVVGSINMDFVVTAGRIPVVGETLTGVDFQTHPGGKGANQAVAVARLGYPVTMVGMVGSDAVGEQLRASLKDACVDVGAVGVAEASSGVASITVSAAGENAIVVVPGANGKVTAEWLDRHEDVIREAGMVLAQLEIPVEMVSHLAAMCARHGVPLMLDPAPACELPAGVMEKVSWFTPNQTEAGFYVSGGEPASAEESVARLRALGCRGVVLKMGEQGAHVAAADGAAEVVPAFRVEAVDTTAAGDAFNGGFAVALMRGASAVEAARFASAVAAVSVTRAGAQGAMPTMDEVEQLLERR